METVFYGIPLDQVTTSMTINSPAAMLLAFYILVGEEQGVPQAQLAGTVQADILKEFIAQKEYIFPPRPSMRVVVDMIRYCTEHMPKFRAARRIWARTMKERFGAKNPRSWMCRCHAQTAGVSLTAQQPYNNVVRTALQALAAVLGGTQSLHTNSLDEALALPTEEAVTIALRTQQVIAHESGVVNTADPLGGSYFVEKLTSDLEAEALDYFRRIDALGGMVAAIERGFPQREIQEAAFQFQKAVERKEKVIVGVNEHVMEENPHPILYIDEKVAAEQTARVAALKATRDNERVKRALGGLKDAARGKDNVMVPILEASRAYATLGEMCDALREVWGEYEEPPVF